MAFNLSGTFSLVSGNPVITGTTISSTWANNTLSDIATGLSTCLLKDGTQTVTANIPMSTYKFTGVGPGTAATDTATLANILAGTGTYVATVGGTADVITLTPSPAIAAYAAGQRWTFIASGANTTNVTVAISGLAARALTKRGSTALVANDIVSGSLVTIADDGTRLQLINVASSVTTTTATNLAGGSGGTIPYQSAAATTAMLANGTAGQLLMANGTTVAPSWTSTLNLAYAVGGTWTAAATWTLPAFTLGGTVSGGGQQLNNIIIGTVTPLAAAVTTFSASGDAALNGANLTTTATTVTAFAGATVALNIGGTGATSTVAIPGTLEATSTTAASLKTAGGLATVKAAFIGGLLNVAGTGQFASTISVGGATPSASGAGITFPATQSASTDANTLDDYEEGTWTIAYIGDSTAGAGTYSYQVGNYVKVGKQVTANGYFASTNHSGTGNILISGYPFQSGVGGNCGSVGYFDSLAMSAGNTIYIGMDSGVSTVKVYQMPTGGGSITQIPMDTAFAFQCSITYFTA